MRHALTEDLQLRRVRKNSRSLAALGMTKGEGSVWQMKECGGTGVLACHGWKPFGRAGTRPRASGLRPRIPPATFPGRVRGIILV